MQHPDITIITNTTGSKLVRNPTLKSQNHTINAITTCSLDTQMLILSDLIKELDTPLQQKIEQIFKKYPAILPTPGKISTVKTANLKIKLNNNKIVYYRPYRLALTERDKVKEIIQELIDSQIIKESESDFASPVLLVKKKRWQRKIMHRF